MDKEALTKKYVDLLDKVNKDIEYGHGEADDILIDLLREIGLGEIAERYENIPAWYA